MCWSTELLRLLGVESSDSLRPVEELIDAVAPDDQDSIRSCIRRVWESGGSAVVDHRMHRRDGSVIDVWHQIERMVGHDGQIYLQGTVQDVSEREKAAAQIKQLAYFDGLTLLPNRELFKERLSHALELAKRHQRSLAILFLDLDDFKRVNDTLGHDAGDCLLRAVADRLRTDVRCSDVLSRNGEDTGEGTIARLGGDEFTVLLTNINGPDDAALVANRILKSLSVPIQLTESQVLAPPSIGISLYPDDGNDVETLLKNADTAMYVAKRTGKNSYQFHDDEIATATRNRIHMDGLLRGAAQRGEFSLHYQPQMDLMTGSVVSVEALLRWHSPVLGPVGPMEFIPLAEESGQISAIGGWVLRTACEQMKRWRDEGIGLSRVAVNISMLQFVRSNFPSEVAEILASTGLPAAELELEITETAIAKDIEGAMRNLNELKTIGVELSIDDFGTGYSNLSQLKRCPIDRVKIDRSFINNITTDPDDAAITTAIINMATSMNLKVLAEGVETHAQLSLLRRRGCDEVQGYYICRPQTVGDLEDYLHRQKDVRTLHPINNEHRGISVLFADDDVVLHDVAISALSREAYIVHTACNAEEGFDILAEHDINVVVSDFNMPGLNGTAFLERVRRMYPTIARILITGVGGQEIVTDGINKAGIFQYLEKPVAPNVLCEAVRAALIDPFHGDTNKFHRRPSQANIG